MTTKNHFRPYVTASRWVLATAAQAGLTNNFRVTALVLIKTTRFINGGINVPKPAALLKSIREASYPIGVVIDAAPQTITEALPARLAHRFDLNRWTLRFTQDGHYFWPERGAQCEICDRADCDVNHSGEWNEQFAAEAENRAWEW